MFSPRRYNRTVLVSPLANFLSRQLGTGIKCWELMLMSPGTQNLYANQYLDLVRAELEGLQHDGVGHMAARDTS